MFSIVVTYLADRQISVRLGQSFWSHGPALSSKFTAKDFPSLKPVAGRSTDDYASVLHAHLDLMQILHNAHSILSSANERTQSMINEGDYPRYSDDLMEAATAWNTNWGNLQVSLKLKSTLRISHEYLCLYINAFSFHAVVTPQCDSKLTEPGSYGLYAAVFLYKTLNAGAVRGHSQQNQVEGLSQAFILTLDEVASTEPHICLGYSVLLRELWQQESGPQVESGPEVQRDQGTHRDHSSSAEDTILVDPSTWSNEEGSQTTLQGIDRVNQPLAGASSSSAEADIGTQDLLSLENYLFKSMWTELANPEHQGDFYDLEGGLLGFDMDPLSGLEPL
ncbi:uncharacterized protein BDZ83DRAFT_653923 [Colletotrichum acutatum]|uniref:Transcription factor domain-containing protein n=1 Tax=Glomerella acutata TaxID=27357 RepID=A0AAD8UG38_GLOAC|nr:uncharacterized protein BDZ83DRAFT_653923 [Colletotrichum acutatum]KAK1722448.1 hypothetical protein BDZ83DRAFT_653923 [Colletotrichum acutatum]